MGTKTDPDNVDCYAKALPDEPMFVLLGRDPFAPTLVRFWANERLAQITRGERPPEDAEHAQHAFRVADELEQWRKDANWKWRSDGPLDVCVNPTPEWKP